MSAKKKSSERYRWFSIVELGSQGMTPEWWLKCNNPLHGHALPHIHPMIPSPMSVTVIMDAVDSHERRYGVAE